MSIRALITEGVGPGGSLLYLLTGGLNIGAAAAIWTPVTASSDTWAAVTTSSDIWTPAALSSDTWTPQ